MAQRKPAPPEPHVHGPGCNHDHEHHPPAEPYRRESPKPGRNDPCFCGSGRKYKKCHGASN
ncbi:MAG: SEC-C domain-containing protein [Gammaproteobacteria bacterium]|nr:SEC-C domain-containing protein [Gammaproteobacteria bacterium]